MNETPARSAILHPLRAVSFNDPAVSIERKSDGTIYLRPTKPLGDYPARITDRLHHWANVAPDRVCSWPGAKADAAGGSSATASF